MLFLIFFNEHDLVFDIIYIHHKTTKIRFDVFNQINSFGNNKVESYLVGEAAYKNVCPLNRKNVILKHLYI